MPASKKRKISATDDAHPSSDPGQATPDTPSSPNFAAGEPKPKKPRAKRKKRSKPLSKLESLPWEIVIMIYEMSDNASFIFCSPKIHGLVSHKSVKLKVIKDCCRDKSLESRKWARAMKNMRFLLQENWLSLGWLKEAGMNWMRKQAMKRFEKFLSSNLSDPEQNRDEHYRKLEKYLTDYQYICQENVAGPSFRYWVNNNAFDLQLPWPPAFARNGNYSSIYAVKTFVRPIDWRAIPERLLTGPWTQTHGDILSFFVFHTKDHWRFRFYELSKKQCDHIRVGLDRAIKELNVPFLIMFGHPNYSSYTQELVEEYMSFCPESHDPASYEVNSVPWTVPRFTELHMGSRHHWDLWSEGLWALAESKRVELQNLGHSQERLPATVKRHRLLQVLLRRDWPEGWR